MNKRMLLRFPTFDHFGGVSTYNGIWLHICSHNGSGSENTAVSNTRASGSDDHAVTDPYIITNGQGRYVAKSLLTHRDIHPLGLMILGEYFQIPSDHYIISNRDLGINVGSISHTGVISNTQIRKNSYVLSPVHTFSHV